LEEGEEEPQGSLLGRLGRYLGPHSG
jgi:hypothetical protein